MIRNKTYDFDNAVEYFNGYSTPQEMSHDLMSASLNLSINDPGVYEGNVLALQRVVTGICYVLDSIKVKGGSDE